MGISMCDLNMKWTVSDLLDQVTVLLPFQGGSAGSIISVHTRIGPLVKQRVRAGSHGILNTFHYCNLFTKNRDSNYENQLDRKIIVYQ